MGSCHSVDTTDSPCHKIDPLPLDTPIYDNKVRFVCMSDTHNKAQHFLKENKIPDGDVFLHGGDFTMHGNPEEVEEFNTFLGDLEGKFKYRLVVAGNHDCPFDEKFLNNEMHKSGYDGEMKHYLETRDKKCASDLLTNCQYLFDEEIVVYGLRIYATPWQSHYDDWGFHVPESAIQAKWDKIPTGVDILLTHEAPIGYGSSPYGSKTLVNTVRGRVRPKYHVFGHMHADYGIRTDGTTTFINASNADLLNLPVNDPIIFDLPLPEGQTK